MNETTAEALILAVNALGAGVLLFVASVVQKMMDDMDPPAFKSLLVTPPLLWLARRYTPG